MTGLTNIQNSGTPKWISQTSDQLGTRHSVDLIRNTQHWILQKGQNPSEGLTRLMKDNKIILLGEQHDANPHRNAGDDYVRALAKGGATHIAIEADPHEQELIDNFMKTGDTSQLLGWMQSSEYLDILRAARESGLKIVAIDNKSVRDRDGYMAQGVRDIVESDPNAKVIVWIGSNHVSDQYRADGTLHPHASVTRRLRESGLEGVVSVNGAWPGQSPFGSLSEIVPVPTPTLIPTSGSPFANVPHERPVDVVVEKGRSFDYWIFYPK